MNELLQYRAILERLPEGYKSGKELRFPCPFGHRHRNGVDRNPSAFAKLGRNGSLIVRCRACDASSREFFNYVGLPPDQWKPERLRMSASAPTVKPKLVESYTYCDGKGEVLAVKDRYEPGWNGQKKTFAWRRPVPGLPTQCFAAGPDVLKGGWFKAPEGQARLWRRCEPEEFGAVELDDISGRITLYRLPQIYNAPVDLPILVVEGERKADRLAQLGFIATTGYGGAGKWELIWGSEFAGRRVCIIPDRDGRDVSQSYGFQCAASALYYAADEIRIVKLPVGELRVDGSGGDIVDWLDRRKAGGQRADRAAVAELCKRAEVFKRI